MAGADSHLEESKTKRPRDSRDLLNIHSSACLLFALRNRLVDKLVKRRALLGGADGAHDGLPYDVAVLVDNVGCREREQI